MSCLLYTKFARNSRGKFQRGRVRRFYEKMYKSSQAHLDLPGHYQQDRGILLASPQLCELSLTLTDGWLAVIVGDLFLMAQVLKLLLKIAEQYSAGASIF